MSGVNWAVELRKIEREFDGLPAVPAVPSPAAQNARRAADRLAQQRQDARSAAIGTWARLLLVAALAVGLGFWPYPRECGTGLFVYLWAAALVSAGALWVVTITWHWRMAKTHGLALLMVLWALALIGAQVLPRVGYAKSDSAPSSQWLCG